VGIISVDKNKKGVTMNKKYELTNETIEINGVKLYRIHALRFVKVANRGELGGFIEKEENLSHDGDCWVFGNACVYGDARIFGNAMVYDNAQVYGNAMVFDNAMIYDNAQVYGHALVADDASVSENAHVYGHASIYGDAKIYGNAHVYGNAFITGTAEVYGNAHVCGETALDGNVQIYGNLKLIDGYFYHTKKKTDPIEKIENDEETETLCVDPKVEKI
jgi:carbonic anhydrase/acetyltransferase-like protein (isoleucine patch superfamily)